MKTKSKSNIKKIFIPLYLSIVIQIANIIVAVILNNHFYSIHNISGCGNEHPSKSPILIIGILGILPSIYSIYGAYSYGRYKAVSNIVAIMSLILGLVAIFLLSFRLCF